MSEEKNNYQCEKCGHIFSTKSNLVTHKRSAKYCGGNRIFKCNECNREFISNYRRKIHDCLKSKQILEEERMKEEEMLEKEKLKEEEISKYYDKKMKEYEDIIRGKDIHIIRIEALLENSEKMLAKANETIAEIAKQPSTTNHHNGNTNNTNSNNSHNINNNMTNIFDINDIPTIEKTLNSCLTTDVLKRGQSGFADMLKNNLLQTKDGELLYECTDVARQKFEFLNPQGFIETDPKAAKLIRNLARSGLYNKAHSTAKDIWTNDDGKIDQMAQDVYMPTVMEILDLDADSSKMRSRLASITVRQKNVGKTGK